MNEKERQAIRDVLSIFEAERDGAETDVPEGVRYITISDTLADQMANRLREILAEDKGPDNQPRSDSLTNWAGQIRNYKTD